MDPVAIARWQFGVTTVYHFLFVPITIAMSMLVAVIQTIWVRTGKERYLRLTKFFGKLFLINFALGVVTGIVQEFQFGMNWSEYSRFVGDVFGAPLALEALIAFFLESTFLGLWIFGWDKLPKKIHLACIYAAAIGTMLSSIFILAANSWMQNPVGTKFNTELNRAELDGVGGFLEVLSNPLLMSALPHVIFASYMVAGGLVAGISAWHLAKPDVSEEDAGAYRWATKFGAWVLIAGSALTFYTGDAQAKAITQLQPSKIAAAEGAFEDTGDFSLLTIPNADQTGTIVEIKIPLVLSFIAGVPQIKGIDTIREQYAEHGYSMQNGSQTNIQGEYAQQLAEKYGHIDPIPNVNATYWSFRMMMAFGGLGLLIAVLWVGFFFLEGFDFGVAMLLPILGRDDKERRVMVNTIGPTWDGNEVWLLTAGGATFAAFPAWYSTMFSALYLPLLLALVGLILRGVAFEYRSKHPDAKWRRMFDVFATYGSFTATLVLGVGFANFAIGLANDGKWWNGSLIGLFGPFALLGGVLFVTLFLIHGATFLTLKSRGEVHEHARGFVRSWGWPVAAILTLFVVCQNLFWPAVSEFADLTIPGWITAVLAVVALAASLVATTQLHREGWGFVLCGVSIVALISGLLVRMYGNLGFAQDNSLPVKDRLNIITAASSETTLTIMTWAAVIFVPIVLAYQAWSYWVFSKRISTKNIPDQIVY